MKKASAPIGSARDGLKRQFGGELLQRVGKFWRNPSAVSTDSLTRSQESAASFGEDSTSVNLLKGMPAFKSPSR